MAFLALDIDPYRFACDGARWGIPHYLNVLTNLPFLAVGAWGLTVLARRGLLRRPAFRNWAGVWISTALVAFGSGAYHWTLTPWGLGADRAAICGIIAFLGAHATDVGLGLGPRGRVTLLCVLFAEGTVVFWALGGTAWVYGALQALGGVAVLGVLLRARRKGRLATPMQPMLLFLLFYALAKVAEVLDAPICDATGIVGGHPIKHLLSAVGLACLGRMMIAEADALPREAIR